ncbi:head-tail adaptor protein [Clostridium sulfidigenes]|uniref:Head-tail adaptor protein n=1 Tax=Clostridium sulfidigenes TaxID=318464 RepID=A0A084J9B9_9CLOT|nr:phage head closure protein [Clostridium sulfidigenes]KEZ85553.1 head-tail adaptor protein [Clostridium sulfidigenes]
MRISSLNKRIDIYCKLEVENQLDEVDFQWDKLRTVWAEMRPQTGKLQNQQANTILANVTHKIIIRFESAKDLTNDMYIIYNNKRFDIKYILNPYFKNETLEIFCEEVVE